MIYIYTYHICIYDIYIYNVYHIPYIYIYHISYIYLSAYISIAAGNHRICIVFASYWLYLRYLSFNIGNGINPGTTLISVDGMGNTLEATWLCLKVKNNAQIYTITAKKMIIH